MYAIVSPDRLQLSAGTVVRMEGTWQDYETLLDCRGDRPLPRLKYRDGKILLMSPLPSHGRDANNLADIVKILLDSQNRNYEAFSPITMKLPKRSGIEPDYCFYITNWQVAVGKERLDWGIDPPPDLAIEIDVTSYTDVDDYLPYRVPEVWLLKRDRLSIYQLQSEAYVLAETSLYFPEFKLGELVADCEQRAATQGTGIAMRELRDRLGLER
jgi:Uma2 family endonuclease